MAFSFLRPQPLVSTRTAVARNQPQGVHIHVYIYLNHTGCDIIYVWYDLLLL